jgi:CheY-like chemotaxis protein
LTILVVDDDEANLTLARALLEADGFAVVTAVDAMSTFDVLKDVARMATPSARAMWVSWSSSPSL